MKLQSLHALNEETLLDIDLDKFTDNVDEKYVKIIKKIFEKLKAYGKISLNDVQEEDMFFHISNGLIDFDLSFSKEDGIADDFFPVLEIAAMVNSEYIFEHEKISENEGYRYSLLNSLAREFGLNRPDRMFDYIDTLLEAASAFADWYFEISGEHGKVKLVKIIYDIVDQSSNNEWRWTPYLGQFSTGAEVSKIRIDARIA